VVGTRSFALARIKSSRGKEGASRARSSISAAANGIGRRRDHGARGRDGDSVDNIRGSLDEASRLLAFAQIEDAGSRGKLVDAIEAAQVDALSREVCARLGGIDIR